MPSDVLAMDQAVCFSSESAIHLAQRILCMRINDSGGYWLWSVHSPIATSFQCDQMINHMSIIDNLVLRGGHKIQSNTSRCSGLWRHSRRVKHALRVKWHPCIQSVPTTLYLLPLIKT